jgi:hypothetical protein
VEEGGEEHAGVIGALLTYCKGLGKGNSVLADLLSFWQSWNCRVIRRGRASGKGCRSKGDSESNIRLVDVRRAWICRIDCGESLFRWQKGNSEVPKGSWIVADYREASQIAGRLRKLQKDFADCRKTSQIVRRLRRLQGGFADIKSEESREGDSSGTCKGVLDAFLSRLDVFSRQVQWRSRVWRCVRGRG